MNYEKHALRVSQVIAAVAKVSCKHGLWLVDRVNYEKHALRVSQVIAAVAKVSCIHGLWLVARANKRTAAAGCRATVHSSYSNTTQPTIFFCKSVAFSISSSTVLYLDSRHFSTRTTQSHSGSFFKVSTF